MLIILQLIEVAQLCPENVECCSCWVGMMTNVANCTREIKSKVAMAKQKSSKKKE
jgi:hypothetical protein